MPIIIVYMCFERERVVGTLVSNRMQYFLRLWGIQLNGVGLY